MLLDTLIRPNADTQFGLQSFVEWRYHPEIAVPHVVFVKQAQCGGVWVSSSEPETDDTGTLSYSEMLSLPGYSFADHHASMYGTALPELRASKVRSGILLLCLSCCRGNIVSLPNEFCSLKDIQIKERLSSTAVQYSMQASWCWPLASLTM